jgi:hypothetical protein
MSSLPVDRARFLALASAIAAATTAMATSCSREPAATPESDGGAASETTDDAGVTPDTGTGSAVREGGVCEDDDGLPLPPCESLDAASGCGAGYCTTWPVTLKSRLARMAITCTTLPTTEGAKCPCAAEALAQACPDPTAAATCADLRSLCADAGLGTETAEPGWQDLCVSLIAGRTSAGRRDFLQCTSTSEAFTTHPPFCSVQMLQQCAY